MKSINKDFINFHLSSGELKSLSHMPTRKLSRSFRGICYVLYVRKNTNIPWRGLPLPRANSSQETTVLRHALLGTKSGKLSQTIIQMLPYSKVLEYVIATSSFHITSETHATYITYIVSIALGLEKLWEIRTQGVFMLYVFAFSFV